MALTVVAKVQKFSIRQNATFSYTVLVQSEGQAINLEDCIVKAQIRAKRSLTSKLLHSWDSTEDDSQVTIVEAEGKVTLKIPKSVCKTFDWAIGFYDVLLTWADGEESVIASGDVEIIPGVTDI